MIATILTVLALAGKPTFNAPNLGKAVQKQEQLIDEVGPFIDAQCRLYGGNRHLYCVAEVSGVFVKITYTPITCDKLGISYRVTGLGTRKTQVPWHHNIFTCKP